MKYLRYIHYFFYIGLNWGWRIAAVIINQEIKGEKKYGIDTTGIDNLKTLQKNGTDISHSTIYMPVSFGVIESAFQQLDAISKKHFIDIGCGKGRAMCVAAHFGFNKITGVDFSASLCQTAKKNLIQIQYKFPKINYAVIHKNALEFYIPDDANCIFLFNPFDEWMMLQIVLNINTSIQSYPRPIRIIYINSLYKNLFTENGFEECYYKKTMEYFEVSILKNRL